MRVKVKWDRQNWFLVNTSKAHSLIHSLPLEIETAIHSSIHMLFLSISVQCSMFIPIPKINFIIFIYCLSVCFKSLPKVIVWTTFGTFVINSDYIVSVYCIMYVCMNNKISVSVYRNLVLELVLDLDSFT